MEKIAQAVRVAEVNGFVAGLIDTGILKVASEEEAAVIADVIEEHLPEEYDMEDAMEIAADVIDALEDGGGEEEGMDDGEGMDVEASDHSINEGAIMAAFGELSLAKEAGDISEEEFEKEAASLQGMVQGARDLGSAMYKGDMRQMAPTLRAAGKESGRYIKENAGKAKTSYMNALKGYGRKGLKKNLSEANKRYGDDMAGVNKLRAGGATAINAASHKSGVYKDLANEIGNRRFKDAGKLNAGAKDIRKTIGGYKKGIAKANLKQGLAIGGAVGAVGGAGVGAKSLYDKYNN